MGPCTASSCCCQARNLPWAPVPTSSCCCQARNLSWAPGTPASSCCCQVQSLSWVPVRPPIAAVSIATLCHVPLSGLLTLLVCSILSWGAGRLRASHCCCQARNLPWAPVPPPHAAARPVICHGSLYGLPLLLSPSPHSAMCHFQVSSHCWCVPFCHRVL
ncbi:unnamed protein product, partial [Staurois parvus]